MSKFFPRTLGNWAPGIPFGFIVAMLNVAHPIFMTMYLSLQGILLAPLSQHTFKAFMMCLCLMYAKILYLLLIAFISFAC